jgi:hypothetical protein
MEEIKLEIEPDKIDKININDNDIDEPLTGSPITMIEVSPKGKYLVTYSDQDLSIVCWNIEDVDKEPKFEFRINSRRIIRMCVSDDKKLACVSSDGLLGKVIIIEKLLLFIFGILFFQR